MANLWKHWSVPILTIVAVVIFNVAFLPAGPLASDVHAQVAPTGFLEICKETQGGLTGTFTFTWNGQTRTVTVAPGATQPVCSPAIELPVGQITITEAAAAGTELCGIRTILPNRLVSTSGRSATVRIVAGGLAQQTILIFCNRPVDQVGNEGCSPGFFKNHPGAFTGGLTPGSTLLAAGLVPTGHPLAMVTLEAALDFGGGPGVEGATRILLRQAVAALLNALHPDVDYPLTAAQVRAQVLAALASGDRATILALASELDRLNNVGCPLS